MSKKGVEITFIISTTGGELALAFEALEPWLLEVEHTLKQYGKLVIFEMNFEKKTFKVREYLECEKTCKNLSITPAGEGMQRITAIVKNGKKAMAAVKAAIAPQLEMFT